MTSEPVDERRLHPAWIATRAITVLRGLVPAFLGLAVGLRAWAIPAVLALVVVIVLMRIVEWRRTRYAVVDGGIRLRHGVFNLKERVIPASRISALDTSRGLIQRLFGLVALQVQTAGGGKHAELKLEALTYEEAERLRSVLGHGGLAAPGLAPRGGSGVAPDSRRHPGSRDAVLGAEGDPGIASDRESHRPPGAAARSAAPAPTPIYAITARQLVVAALTGPQITVVGVLVGSLIAQGDDLVPDRWKDRVGDFLSGADPVTIAVLVIVGVALAAVVSIVGTVLAFAEFTVLRDDRRLRVRRGLITERTGTIPLDRIQGVRIVEGLLRRPLGYATVQVELAGYRGDDESARTLVPLIHRSELPALLTAMVPEVPAFGGPLERPPARARRRYYVAPLVLSLVPLAAAMIFLPDAWRFAAVVPPLLGLALGESRWRGAAWALGPETLTVRSQLLARSTLLALARRSQHVAVWSLPLQRRAGLASFKITLATGRNGEVVQMDRDVAAALQRAVAARTAGRRPPPLHSPDPAGVAQSVRAAES